MKGNLKHIIFHVIMCLSLCTNGYGDTNTSYDIVIYGGTSAGVIAGIQAAKMGKSVVIIEPGKHPGGMTSSGLGYIDVHFPKLVAGLTWEYLNRALKYYALDSSWIWETKKPFKGQLFQFHPDIPLMWVLEPHVAEIIFNQMIAEANIPIIYNERLNRDQGVQLEQNCIVQITMESGLAFKGKMFIDASYEGDLMASSNVSYKVGREPNSLYQETVNGIHPNLSNPFISIDPFQIQGNPQSGLLPRVYPNAEGNIGDGDQGVQAYAYRMCLTDVPDNQVPIAQPEGYDESQYELLFRAFETGGNPNPVFTLDLLPNRKTDSNNRGLISTDYIGMNWNYPEADYDTRQEIALQHELWQRGLVWTLQNHPRIPPEARSFYAPWGLPKDEFVDNQNWPYLLYIRESRRMISPVVITEGTVRGNVPVNDSVGLGCYAMDSHDVKYIVNANGFLETDGGLFEKVPNSFPISFQAIVPSKQECENLLVPVCLSASHVGYGAVRIETTFMTLGQSAATAASLAIDLGVAIQDLPYATLKQQLLLGGQKLE